MWANGHSKDLVEILLRIHLYLSSQLHKMADQSVGQWSQHHEVIVMNQVLR